MGRCADSSSSPAGRTGSNPFCLAEFTKKHPYFYAIEKFLSVLTIRTTKLRYNHLCHLRICLGDLHRILQSFFIIPHKSASPFLPWPWLIDPVPFFAVGTNRGVYRQRSEVLCVFLQRFVAHATVFPEKFHCFLIAWMRIQVELYVIDRKADFIDVVQQICPAGVVFHRFQPPLPRNGLSNSSKMVPQRKPSQISLIPHQVCHGTYAIAMGIS